MTTVIQAEGLGKRYRRGTHVDAGLRHALERFARSPWRALRGERPETFWALKDVSLAVKEGEVLGLIGRNGAGKTTLLKILSRITRPTEGWAEIRGRVRSLLEVGTGFHPELTGRENTYLSGSILGMSKREIDRKFDEIVAFAEIEKFVETPVKHYSSGMYVRLAFAVAAHLEPEILLVDEVLAVGDITFQKKCLGKMGEVARGGRTVVLVSHQLNQIRRLCERVAWVDAGQIRLAGETHDPVKLKFRIEIRQPISEGHYGVALRDHEQQVIWAWETRALKLDVGERELCHTFPTLPLRPGLYTWLVALYDEGDLIDIWDCVREMMVAAESFQHPQDEWSGVLNIPVDFEVDGERKSPYRDEKILP